MKWWRRWKQFVARFYGAVESLEMWSADLQTVIADFKGKSDLAAAELGSYVDTLASDVELKHEALTNFLNDVRTKLRQDVGQDFSLVFQFLPDRPALQQTENVYLAGPVVEFRCPVCGRHFKDMVIRYRGKDAIPPLPSAANDHELGPRCEHFRGSSLTYLGPVAFFQ